MLLSWYSSHGQVIPKLLDSLSSRVLTMNVFHALRNHIWSHKRNSVNGMGAYEKSYQLQCQVRLPVSRTTFEWNINPIHASKRITDIHIGYFAHTADQKSCRETKIGANRKNLRGIRHIVPLKLTFRPGGWAILVTWASFNAYRFDEAVYDQHFLWRKFPARGLENLNELTRISDGFNVPSCY